MVIHAPDFVPYLQLILLASHPLWWLVIGP